MRSVAADLKGQGVIVGIIGPGSVETEMYAQYGADYGYKDPNSITTAQSVTGGSSGNFSVAGSSIFTTSAAADLTIVGKFNIKFWVRFTTVAANSCYFFSQGTAAAAGCRAQIGSAGTISFVVLGNAASNKGSIAINTWYKIEIDRAADNTTRILIDDVVVHNFGAIPANQAGNQTVYLGGWVPSDGPQSGLCWVDDFTMTIG